MRSAAALLLLLVGCTPPHAPPGGDVAAPPTPPTPVAAPGVDERIVVTLSVPAEYDPEAPGDARLTVTVRNVSAEPVEISGGDVAPGGPRRIHGWPSYVLHGEGASHRWPSRRWHEGHREAPPTLALAPGVTVVALDSPLSEVLPARAADLARRPKWRWNWMAHPESPESPIARWREPGYEETARLWTVVVTDRGAARSAEVTLTVRRR